MQVGLGTKSFISRTVAVIDKDRVKILNQTAGRLEPRGRSKDRMKESHYPYPLATKLKRKIFLFNNKSLSCDTNIFINCVGVFLVEVLISLQLRRTALKGRWGWTPLHVLFPG